MANEYWLTDEVWEQIEPLLPMNRRGVKPMNNRCVISGILHVLKHGCRWRDCPAVKARIRPSTTGSITGPRLAYGIKCFCESEAWT